MLCQELASSIKVVRDTAWQPHAIFVTLYHNLTFFFFLMGNGEVYIFIPSLGPGRPRTDEASEEVSLTTTAHVAWSSNGMRR